MLGGLRPVELLIIVAVVILLFGAKKLPDLARSIGASAKEFKKGVEEGSDDVEGEDEDQPEETIV